MNKKDHNLFYQTMKSLSKKRKMKWSPQHNLYWSKGEYFYSSFVHESIGPKLPGKMVVYVRVYHKYKHYDELNCKYEWPGKELHFTDKLRANSVAMVLFEITREDLIFDFDHTEERCIDICENVLNRIEEIYAEFEKEVEENYGTLGDYYLDNKEISPLFAALTLLDRGDIEGAKAVCPNNNWKFETE